jgi:hypothetical protein
LGVHQFGLDAVEALYVVRQIVGADQASFVAYRNPQIA